MILNQLYRSFLKELCLKFSGDEAAVITSMIFEKFAGVDKALLLKEPENLANDLTIKRISESLESLKMNMPVQYIIEEAWFFKMKLKVSPAVLIPRPETEELTAAAIHFLKEEIGASVLDIGTGSGCIAIAIKKNLSSVSVTATDLSKAALSIAEENASGQSVIIQFIETDFLQSNNWKKFKKYDCIISNPPYIPETEKEGMDKNVTDYEPALALFVTEKQPLIFYKQIALFGKEHLNINGKIFVETHEAFAEQTTALFSENFYSTVIKKDIFGKQRFVIATRCQ